MTVYVVTRSDRNGEDRAVVAVFSSNARAEAYLREAGRVTGDDDYAVGTFEVDALVGVRSGTLYSCTVHDGGKTRGDTETRLYTAEDLTAVVTRRLGRPAHAVTAYSAESAESAEAAALKLWADEHADPEPARKPAAARKRPRRTP